MSNIKAEIERLGDLVEVINKATIQAHSLFIKDNHTYHGIYKAVDALRIVVADRYDLLRVEHRGQL